VGINLKRILIIGESPFAPTRFGTTIRQIGSYLKSNGWDVAALGFGYSGWPFKSIEVNYPLYPWIGPPVNPHNIKDVLEEWKPDTLLLIGAPLLFGWLKDYPERKSYRVVLHTTFRSLPINKMMRDVYMLADSIIVNSHFEEKAILKELPDISVQYIPYGVDIKNLKRTKLPFKDNNQFGVACVTKDIPKIDFPSLLKVWGIVARANQNISECLR
jgi:glycosyltransferase involved in cell wall biosynthesis